MFLSTIPREISLHRTPCTLNSLSMITSCRVNKFYRVVDRAILIIQLFLLKLYKFGSSMLFIFYFDQNKRHDEFPGISFPKPSIVPSLFRLLNFSTNIGPCSTLKFFFDTGAFLVIICWQDGEMLKDYNIESLSCIHLEHEIIHVHCLSPSFPECLEHPHVVLLLCTVALQ